MQTQFVPKLTHLAVILREFYYCKISFKYWPPVDTLSFTELTGINCKEWSPLIDLLKTSQITSFSTIQ